MKKCLTIAIPTFNRAELLDRQLQWLTSSIQGWEEQCEVVLANNCSTDQTEVVVQRYQNLLGKTLNYHRHTVNIGAIRNIAFCLEQATSRFVWVISDDDPIFEDSLPKLLHLLKSAPDLAFVFLNFIGFDPETATYSDNPCFALKEDEDWQQGKPLFEKYLARDGWGALVFTTACVYRTAFAQQALKTWQDGIHSLMFQLYISAFCALQGRSYFTKDPYLAFANGRSFFQRNLATAVRLHGDLSEIFAQLLKLGYSREVCQQAFGVRFQDRGYWIMLIKFLIQKPILGWQTLCKTIRAAWILYR